MSDDLVACPLCHGDADLRDDCQECDGKGVIDVEFETAYGEAQ